MDPAILIPSRSCNNQSDFVILIHFARMSKIFGNNDWNNHVALVIHLPVDQALLQQINNGAFANLNDGAISLTINNLQKMLGEEIQVLSMQSFKTPFSELQFTSLIGYHEYAVIQTQSKHQKIYWSTQKSDERIWLTAYNSFEQCRDFGPTNEKRCKTQYWKPALKKQNVKPSNADFYDIVRWIYEESRNKNDYGFFKNSSNSFVQNIFKKFK